MYSEEAKVNSSCSGGRLKSKGPREKLGGVVCIGTLLTAAILRGIGDAVDEATAIPLAWTR
jgi:hypothetical protein